MTQPTAATSDSDQPRAEGLNGSAAGAGLCDAVSVWFDRRRWWLWLLIAMLYAVGFNGQWRIGSDSAIHVTIARSLAQGQGFTHQTGLESTINPGLAYLTAAAFKLFGGDRFVAIDAVMLFTALGALGLVYWVIRLRLDRPTAVLVVCMLAVNETFYRYGYQVLTDMPFLMGLLLLLLGYELFDRSGKSGWLGAAVMLASVLVMAVFRSVVLTVLAAGALLVMIRMIRGPGRLRYAGVALGVLAVLALTKWLDPRMSGGMSLMFDESRVVSLFGDKPVSSTLHRVFMENGPKIITEHLPESMFGVDFGPVLSAPLGLLAICLGVMMYRLRPLWGLLFAAFLVQWLVFITTERYMLVVMPLLALGWWRLGPWLEKRLAPSAARWAVIVILAVWFVPNLVRVGGFIAEQRHSPFLENYERGRYAALTKVADQLNEITRPGDLIIADHSAELTYYTGLAVHGPRTLPTYGPARSQTVEKVKTAPRVLLVKPIEAALNERVENLKLRERQVLHIVPTPGYAARPEHRIVRMRMRQANWELWRQGRESRLRDRPADKSQSDSQQQPGESEQPDDQPH